MLDVARSALTQARGRVGRRARPRSHSRQRAAPAGASARPGPGRSRGTRRRARVRSCAPASRRRRDAGSAVQPTGIAERSPGNGAEAVLASRRGRTLPEKERLHVAFVTSGDGAVRQDGRPRRRLGRAARRRSCASAIASRWCCRATAGSPSRRASSRARCTCRSTGSRAAPASIAPAPPRTSRWSSSSTRRSSSGDVDIRRLPRQPASLRVPRARGGRVLPEPGRAAERLPRARLADRPRAGVPEGVLLGRPDAPPHAERLHDPQRGLPGGVRHSTRSALLGLALESRHDRRARVPRHVSYLKGGMVFSELVTTVSPQYAGEIQAAGARLRLRRRRALAGRGRLRDPERRRLRRVGPARRPAPRAEVLARRTLPGRPPARATCCEPRPARVPGPAARRDHLAARLAEGLRHRGRRVVGPAAARRCAWSCSARASPRSRTGSAQLAERAPDRFAVRFGYDEALAHKIMGGRRHVPDALAQRAVRPDADVRAALRHGADRARDGRPRGHGRAVRRGAQDRHGLSLRPTRTAPASSGRSTRRSPPTRTRAPGRP